VSMGESRLLCRPSRLAPTSRIADCAPRCRRGPLHVLDTGRSIEGRVGAIGFVAPADKLAGRENEIWARRDERLEAARERRALARQAARNSAAPPTSAPSLTTLPALGIQ
ncbi:MAG: hypothetical protein MJD61_14530, partial [Proteobacteria bacterium]|nr:hypothetical protein [Pseudomonadota bacterium]